MTSSYSTRGGMLKHRIRAAGIGAGVLALVLIPVLTCVQAAGQHTLIKTTPGGVISIQWPASLPARAKARSSTVRLKSSASLGPLETIEQTLNNCGPASIAEVLAYWHIERSEAQVAAVLRADDSYWGMSPLGLPAYARSLGMRALVGYGGTEKLIKLLIANGFPVIVSQYVSSSDPIRHYRPIEAYSDRNGTFVSADPYLGAGHAVSYPEFNAIWSESNFRFQVIYPPSRQARLAAVLRASGWSRTRTYTQAIRWEEQQMQTSAFGVPGSWIWYNGYADVAFDEAQLGRFRKALAALKHAAQQGVSPILVGWVRSEIRFLAQQ